MCPRSTIAVACQNPQSIPTTMLVFRNPNFSISKFTRNPLQPISSPRAKIAFKVMAARYDDNNIDKKITISNVT